MSDFSQLLKVSSPHPPPSFSPYRTQRRYVAKGWCHIPLFLPTETIDEMKREAQSLLEDPATSFESTDMYVQAKPV